MLLDIDECSFNYTCEGACRNTIGSYMCECDVGFKLYSTKRCGGKNLSYLTFS